MRLFVSSIVRLWQGNRDGNELCRELRGQLCQRLAMMSCGKHTFGRKATTEKHVTCLIAYNITLIADWTDYE